MALEIRSEVPPETRQVAREPASLLVETDSDNLGRIPATRAEATPTTKRIFADVKAHC